MNPITSFGVFRLYRRGPRRRLSGAPLAALIPFAAAALIAPSLKMANVRQKFVILRMGKLQSVKGAGLFAIIPVIDSIVAIVDCRIRRRPSMPNGR